MLKKMVVMVMVALTVITGTQVQAHAQAPVQYTETFSDMEGSDLTLKRTERMVKYTENHIADMRPNRVYTINKFRGFKVLVITNRKGRELFYKTAESRFCPLITVEYGWMDNNQGDGHTGDGCYIGYRVNGQAMKFNQNRSIRTICVQPGTDQYTDSIAYRKDVQR